MSKLKIARLPVREQTEKQISGIGDAFGALTHLMGFSAGVSGTYATYRQMRSNPTVALARAVAIAPLRTASWSVEAKRGSEDETIKEFIQEEMNKHWKSFLKDILFALDYGWAPFEKVWSLDQEGRLVYRKLKPLLVDRTVILTDRITGVFTGFRNIAVDLSSDCCFLFTYDKEAGNLYGRSRHENIRASAWTQWNTVMERYGKYITKVSGIIPMIRYPPGKSIDASGSEIDNFDIAKKVLANLGSGLGVTMPNELMRWAEDAVKSGVDIAKLEAWIISFLEAKGNHGRQFNETLRHLESLMMRGWLVPERAAIEGQFGTKAEAAVQGQVGTTIADLLYDEILEQINWYIVNPLLVYNYGREHENKFFLKRAGLNPELRELLAKVMEKVLSEPDNIDLFMRWINVEAAIDSLSLPRSVNEANQKEPTLEEEAKKSMKDLNDKLEAFVG